MVNKVVPTKLKHKKKSAQEVEVGTGDQREYRDTV